MGHLVLPLHHLPARFTDSIKTQLVAGHLKAGCFHQFLRPSGDVTELKLDHLSAFFADDMMMVILYFAELIFPIRPRDDFEDHSEGFEEVEGSIDGGETDLPLFPLKTPIEVLWTYRPDGIGQLLIDQEPWEAQPEAVFLEDGS
jgi:hypothetical protein